MGRKKLFKTPKQQEEYTNRRREQNRVNQFNFRLRRKMKEKIKDVSYKMKNYEYKNQLSKLLKEQNFNFFITLTTKQERTLKQIKITLDHFLGNINNHIKVERLYFVVEKKNRPHIHILLKTDTDIKSLNNSVGIIWNEGFINTKNIYSGIDDYTLEEYLIKEINFNSPEINWGII
jgi:hypothetical protein